MTETRQDTQTLYEKRMRSFVKILLPTLLLVGFLLLLTGLAPFEAVKQNVDRFAADGGVDSFTSELYARIRPYLVGFSLGLIAVCAIGLAWLRKTTVWLTQFFKPHGSLKAHLYDGMWSFLNSMKQCFSNPPIWIALLSLIMISFFARLLFLNYPMRHDEAYSITIFAMEPFRNAISDYHVPNNHIFHTVLVHIMYRLFGAEVWAVRLPAFLAGILIVPAGYLTARKLYYPAAAWLAGLTMAVVPVLIDYSSNARGYTLMALFFLLLLWLAASVKRKFNLVYWGMIILLGALGFYTLPMMLYPIGIMYTWLGIAWLTRDYSSDYDRLRFLKYLLVTGILMSVLGLALYLPVFRATGLSAFFGNEYVESLSLNSFYQTFLVRMRDTWGEWTKSVPVLGQFLYVLGLIFSLIFHRRVSREKIPTQLAAAIFLPLILLVQRPNPWAKIWLFFLPLTIIWASAGLLAPFLSSGKKFPLFGRQLKPVWWVNLILGILMIVGSVRYTLAKYPGFEPWIGDIERTVRYLDDQLRSDDIVIITAPDDAPLWYYFREYGLSSNYLLRDVPFERAFVVVTTAYDQTPEQVIAERGPDMIFFEMDTMAMAAQFGGQEIYLVKAHESAIEKVYGEQPE